MVWQYLKFHIDSFNSLVLLILQGLKDTLDSLVSPAAGHEEKVCNDNFNTDDGGLRLRSNGRHFKPAADDIEYPHSDQSKF